MREKFARFMQGRYGNDRFNQCLMIIALLCLVLSFFGLDLFYMAALLFLIYGYFRMFSKNIYKRAAENQWYLKKENAVRRFFQGKKKEFAQRKTHHIYKCPNCKQKIRVPRGKGKIEISCRKCGARFIRNS